MRTITTDGKICFIVNSEIEVTQLTNHDWFYGMSDDRTVRARGRAAEKVLVEEFGIELIRKVFKAMMDGTFGCFTTEAPASTTKEDNMSVDTNTTKPTVNTLEYHQAVLGYFRDYCLSHKDEQGRKTKEAFGIQLNRAWTGKQELFTNLSSRKDGDTVCIRIRKPAYDSDKYGAGRAMRALAEAVRAAGWKAEFVSGRYSGELHISKN